jgi:hypothetical protein
MVFWTRNLFFSKTNGKHFRSMRHTPARVVVVVVVVNVGRRSNPRFREFAHPLCLVVVVVSVAYPGERRAIRIGRSIRFARSDVVVGASTVRSRGSRGGDAR